MPCKFCGENRPTVRAHIIPRSLYPFENEREPQQPLILITPQPYYRESKSPVGEYDSSMLCEPCEQRFSPWDETAHELFNNSDRWTVYGRYNGEQVAFRAEADYAKLKLFFISLLWRAHATTRPMFQHVHLGFWEATVKHLILTKNPGDQNDFAVLLQRYSDLKHPGPILDPRPTHIGRRRFYRFYLGSIIAHIKVDFRPVRKPFDDHCLAPSKSIVAFAKKFAGGPEERMLLKAAHQIKILKTKNIERLSALRS